MRRIALLVGLAVGAGVLPGCVERRYVVTSDPPGALVLRNNQPIGAAPADDHFVYYGKYHFTLIKDGYTTLQVDQQIAAPWYEYFPLDFISETLVPFKIQDVRRFCYRLEPLQTMSTNELLNRAEELRNRGQSIAAPAAPIPAPVVVPAAVPPGTP
jgi:hypothetical protein